MAEVCEEDLLPGTLGQEWGAFRKPAGPALCLRKVTSCRAGWGTAGAKAAWWRGWWFRRLQLTAVPLWAGC